MRGPLTVDDVEELETGAGTSEQHRAVAAQLRAWAEEPHPDDERITPAVLLVSAGEQLDLAGDNEAALVLFRCAVTAQGSAPPDTRCYLHHGLLRVGDGAEARKLADELRRERPTDGDVYLLIGQNYERADDLVEAHRWFTMGLTHMENQVQEGNDLSAAGLAALALVRFRVRRALNLPPDEYDTVFSPEMGDN